MHQSQSLVHIMQITFYILAVAWRSSSNVKMSSERPLNGSLKTLRVMMLQNDNNDEGT